MSRIKNVLLDLDGTLTDPQAGITRSIAHALERLGHAPPATKDLLFAIGPPLRGSFSTLLDTHDPALIEQAMTIYRERFATIGLFENEIYAGVPQMLSSLETSGYRLILATAKPHIYAARILEHFNVRSPFTAVYGSELDGTRQDKHDLLAYLLEREKLDASTCVMVGDRSHDFDAAHTNGCASIAVTWGYGNTEEWERADRKCEAPDALPSVIEALSFSSSSKVEL